MAVEFTIWEVPKGTEAVYMPFSGLEQAKVVFDERHPDMVLHELINTVRDLTDCTDDYVKVPEVHHSLIEAFVETIDPDKDYVLSCH